MIKQAYMTFGKMLDDLKQDAKYWAKVINKELSDDEKGRYLARLQSTILEIQEFEKLISVYGKWGWECSRCKCPQHEGTKSNTIFDFGSNAFLGDYCDDCIENFSHTTD